MGPPLTSSLIKFPVIADLIYERLVREMNSRFMMEETHKTYRIQFGRRKQIYRESVGEYASELKRLYDRAYEQKYPEIRQQALVDRFLSGLRDHDLRFAVEWSKEPSTIEEAVRHVVHYMEAKQGHGYDNISEYSGASQYVNSRKVTFSDESDDSDDEPDRQRSVSRSPLGRSRHSVRQVGNADGKPSIVRKQLTPPNGNVSNRDILQTLQQLCRYFDNGEGTNKEDKPAVNQSGDKFAHIQCYHCRNFGHVKRDCPELVYQIAPPSQSPRPNIANGIQRNFPNNGPAGDRRPPSAYRPGSQDRRESQQAHISLN